MLFTAGCINQPPQEPSLEEKYADQITAAENLTKLIGDRTTNLSLDLREAAKIIAEDPANETLVDQEFTDLYLSYHSLKAFMIVDTTGRIIDACPAGTPILTSHIGITIQDPHFTYSADSPDLTIIEFWKNGHNVSAAVLPMITTNGTYNGLLLAIIDPALYYETLIYTFQQNTGYTAWIIGTNGGILYTPDRTQMETNILNLTSPDQTELDQLTEKILSTKSGIETYATYSYGKLKIVNRVAAWDTVPSSPHRNTTGPVIVVTSDIDSTQQVAYPIRTTNQKLEDFVRSAYLFARDNGQEAAVAEFNKPDGNFTTQEYYIAAFDMNNTLLANPYHPGIIGTDRTPYEDINGVATVQMFTARAGQGGGYVTHVYENPADDMAVELKISYVLPVNDTWYITAGDYHPDISPAISPETRMNMTWYAREVITLIQKEGKAAAVAALNNGSLSRDTIELNIYDYDGNPIVQAANPWTSKNLLGITDIYRASIGRGTITLAKNGGGFTYINLPLENDATTQLSLKYVQPIDNEWFIMLTVPMK